jgi:hypothetical protein
LAFVLALVAVIPSALTAAGIEGAVDDAASLIAEAEAVYDRWTDAFDFIDYENQLRTAIGLWEDALERLLEEDVQSASQILNSLSQAYFELTEGYLTDPGEREAGYEAGKDAALASLRLDPVFVAAEAEDGFRAALRAATDIAAIFWYGNNLGQWLNFHLLTAVTSGVKDVHASFQRSIELDETYDGGGPHRAIASLIDQAYFLIAPAREDAVFHFERSIAIDPYYLETYVNYAEATDDDALADELLATVLALAEDPAVMATHPFYNHRALQRAERMTR